MKYDGAHRSLGMSECIELQEGLYFIHNGVSHAVTYSPSPDVDWDISLIAPKKEEIKRLLDEGDKKGLLVIYNTTYKKNICCPPDGIEETFRKALYLIN